MKLILEIPDNINVDEHEMKCMMAAKLYEAGKLSLGQAAQVAGMSKVDFANVLHQYDVSLIAYPVSEMLRDAKAI